MTDFKVGQLVIYKNRDMVEIGKIKSLKEEGAFVYYHSGSTAAFTNYSLLLPIINDYCIKKDILGGVQA